MIAAPLVPLDAGMMINLERFVVERERIYLRRRAGEPRHRWTTDPILASGHFCNVYRENDRVSVWISTNWRTPNAASPDLWFAMLLGRLINQTETLGALGYPHEWRPDEFKAKLTSLRSTTDAVFGNAYLVIGSSCTGKRKEDWVADSILTPAWQRREEMRPTAGETLAAVHARLCTLHGISSFLAAQVVADLKYVEPLRSAPDWSSWCAAGPGSTRGRNRVRGLHPDAPTSLKDWEASILEIQAALNAKFASLGWEPLHAQDVQNCLCEFDKYCRADERGGKMRRKFTPRSSSHDVYVASFLDQLQ